MAEKRAIQSGNAIMSAKFLEDSEAEVGGVNGRWKLRSLIGVGHLYIKKQAD